MNARHILERTAFGAACCLAVFVAGCGERTPPPVPQSGGRLVVGLLTEPQTLNPLLATTAESQEIINMIFGKLLVEQDDFLNFAPGLAERWFFSGDSLAITFQLRRGLMWHDGTPFTAGDVRYTWELHRDSRIAWRHRGAKGRIRDVEILDDRTVRFHFSERYPYQLMDANDGVILPRHILEGVAPADLGSAAFARAPTGTGPFRFVQWEPGQFVELAANPTYHRSGYPRLERVIFRFVPDMTTLVTLLKTGAVDCLESVPADVVDALESYPTVRLHRYLSRAATCVVWNVEHELFADPEVRYGLAMAIDAESIIDVVWGGMAQPLDSPMHPVLWAYRPAEHPIAYDPERSREHLAGRGWRDHDGDGILDKGGVPFEFEMVTNQGNQQRADVITMVQAYLRQVGVKVNARTLEGGAFFESITRGRFDSCVLGWRSPTKVDLTAFWGSDGVPPKGFNAARYRNPELDELIERATRIDDPAVAGALWAECQRIIYEDQPVFFLSVPYNVTGLGKRFCGVVPNAISFFANVEEWFVSEQCAHVDVTTDERGKRLR